MSGAPAFSIVIPAYNYAHFLRRAVTSACTQDGADVEVLVVDDGSTDDTPAVMDKLSAEFGERLTYHRQPNQGPAAARAKGLALARHDWLVFLDADDELLPGALRVFADLIAAHPRSRVAIAGHLARHGEREVVAFLRGEGSVMGDDLVQGSLRNKWCRRRRTALREALPRG